MEELRVTRKRNQNKLHFRFRGVNFSILFRDDKNDNELNQIIKSQLRCMGALSDGEDISIKFYVIGDLAA